MHGTLALVAPGALDISLVGVIDEKFLQPIVGICRAGVTWEGGK